MRGVQKCVNMYMNTLPVWEVLEKTVNDLLTLLF